MVAKSQSSLSNPTHAAAEPGADVAPSGAALATAAPTQNQQDSSQVSHSLSLAGRVALVTGAARRVGKAIALRLGQAQMRVAVHHHASAAAAEQTCDEIRRAGGQAFALQADLFEPSAAERVVDDVLQHFGQLDLLVPSAANFERLSYAEVDLAAFERAMQLNLRAPFILAKRASVALKQARGSIVCITCSSAQVPFRNYLPYVVSKGALRQLVRVLALELAPEVRVNAVAPGVVLPPEEMTPQQLASLVARVPLQTRGAAQDIAEAVFYLATAPFVTGHELVVDGGRNVAALERYT